MTTIVFCLLLILPASKLVSHDSTSLNYGVDTLKISVDLSAGEIIEREIRIYNLKNREQDFEFTLGGFKIFGENGQIRFEEIDKNTIQPSISVEPGKIKIPANSSKKVKVQFSVDEAAGLREYNYVIFVNPEISQTRAENSRTLIEGRIGILTFINVVKDGKTLGEVTRRGGILEFDVAEINLKSPVKFSAKIGNSGNIHYDAASSLEILNSKNKLIDTIKLKDITVLPGMVRTLESVDNTEIKWDYGLKSGKYRAVLNVNSPDGDIRLKDERIFYIVPLTQLILILPLIIFLFIAVIFIRKRIVKKRKVE